MSYQLDFNGRVALEPISINKVNRYYTNQQEVLREPAVLSSRSKKGELLYLVTIPFDAQDEVSIEKLVDTVSMCKAFPYAFIKCEAMEDPAITIGSQVIGDGYFMYAIHEYEIEVSSDEQGVFLLSLRLQPVNWRALTREMHFLSINEVTDESGKSQGPQFSYHSNPGESNILEKMVKYYSKGAEQYSKELMINSKSKGQQLTFGAPVVSVTTEQASKVKNKVGEDRIFRIFHPIQATGTEDDDDNITTGRPNVSEISKDTPNQSEENSRVIVSYSGHSLGADKSNAIISMVVRRRNRFANQTVVDFVLPFCQYLGKSPSELLVSVASNEDDMTKVSDNMTHASRLIEAMNSFIDVVKSSYPYLISIDAFRVENPITKLMGIDYAILDSSQTSATSDMNNVVVCNYTFLESNQGSLLERSKYTQVSSDKAEDLGDIIKPILEMINIIKSESRKGNNPPELKAVHSEILKIYPTIESQIKSDTALIAKNKNNSGMRVLGDLSGNEAYTKANALGRVELALKYVQSKYGKRQEGLSPSEWRVINEKIRYITSAINNTYMNVISKNGANKYVQEIVVREVMAEQERIDKYGEDIILSGEAAPDLFIKEIFKDIPNIDGMETWKVLSTLPFIYDKPEIDPAKLSAMWASEKDRIEAAYKPLEGYLTGPYGSESKIPKYNGETLGSISDYGAQLTETAKVNSSSIAGSASGTSSPPPQSSTGWLSWNQVCPGFRLGSKFGQVRSGSNGLRFHKGIDVNGAGINGTPIYAIADGTATALYDANGYGNWVRITHNGSNAGFETRYGHMSRQAFKGSKTVRSGEIIGYVGSTGRSSGPHLHLDIIYKGTHLDPERFSRNNTDTWYTTGALTKLGDVSTRKYTPGTNVPASRVTAQQQQQEIRQVQNAGIQSKNAIETFVNKTIGVESSGNANARNGKSSAGGLGQFIDETWVSMVKKYRPELAAGKNRSQIISMKYDGDLNREMTTNYTKENAEILRKAGLPVTEGNLYLAHFSGPGTAVKALKANPNAAASTVYGPGQIAANKTVLQGKTVGQVVAWANQKMGSKQASIFSNKGGDALDEIAAYKSGEYYKFEMNPIPWDEELQAQSRINNLAKDFSIGIQKLIPTYKIYLVYGNDENSLYHMLNANLSPKFFELPSVRNIRVEMANQENPVSVAYFEVLNSMNTAVNPQGTSMTAPSHKLDVSALGSDFSDINVYDQIRLKAGNKIQIRMGAGNDPNSLDVVFNGIITESSGGEVVRVIAEGYGRELQNELLFGIDTSLFGAIGDNQFISFKVGQVLKNANLQHFGRTAKLFGQVDGQRSQTNADQNGLNSTGFDYRNNLWDSSQGNYFLYDFMGASDTVENYWLTSVDTIDASILSFKDGIGSRLADLLPFSRDDFIRDFKITNKTVWETIETGVRLFPSSIALVKDMGARSTTFVGIKEQMMYKYSTNNKLLQGIGNNIDKDVERKDTRVLDPVKEAKEEPKGFFEKWAQAIGESRMNGVSPGTFQVYTPAAKTAENMMKDAIEANGTQTAQLTMMLKDYYRAPPNAWRPATNFHIISSSYNLLSNQLKLNGNLTTGVQVEFGGDEPYEYGSGMLDTFELKVNGNLHPAFVSYDLLSDTTISTQILAQRAASGYLINQLEKAYTGALIITGNAGVAPGDYAFLTDSSRGLTGVIKCREVHHVFTEEDGFITIITPGMYVEPATHLYSTLYFKLSMFYGVIGQALEESRRYYSAYSPAGLSYISVVMSDKIFNPGDIGGLATANLAAGGLSAYGAYKSVAMLAGKSTGAWQSLAASSFGRSLASGAMGQRATAMVTYASRLLGPARTAAGSALGMVRGGLAVTPPGIIATVVGSIALGLIGNLYDKYESTAKLQHRALLKFPLMAYGKEYQPGLRGWNDTKGILDVQIDNIKRTLNNMGVLYDAANANTGDSMNWRLLGKLLSD